MMNTQYQSGQMVKVTALPRTLPKLAAQFVGRIGQVISVSQKYGLVYIRVKFPEGEAIYQPHEITEAPDVA